MSDDLPLEIQSEIFNKLPLKSLIQFRSVSKTYKSLIDSSDFIAHYRPQHQHLLVRYNDAVDFDLKYLSIVDDHTFPQHKVYATVPPLVNKLKHHRIIGCSHGLLCLYGYYDNCPNERCMAVVWNLSIRKAVAVVVPNVEERVLIGFGVCQKTSDPKIIKITHINHRWRDTETISSIPCQVEVFTLSTGVWRRLYSSNLPRESIQFHPKQVVVGGFVYWLAADRIITDGGYTSCNVIVSFDMTSEEFREVKLPDSLTNTRRVLHVYNLRDSLAVVEFDEYENNPLFVVWMMKDGVVKSFMRLYMINIKTPQATIRGFGMSGAPIVEIVEDDRPLFVVYEPYSKHTDYICVQAKSFSFLVYPYTETLLLLNQPDLMR